MAHISFSSSIFVIFVVNFFATSYSFLSKSQIKPSKAYIISMRNANNNDNNDIIRTDSLSLKQQISPIFLRSAIALLVAIPTLAKIPNDAYAVAPSEEKYLDALATLITCKKVLESVDQYIEVQVRLYSSMTISCLY